MKSRQFFEDGTALEFQCSLQKASGKRLMTYLELAQQAVSAFLRSPGAKGLGLSKKIYPELVVGLVICGDSKMRRLNREYRGLDKTTDVLSFPLHPDWRKVLPALGRTPQGPIHLGDIFISLPKAQKQAREFNVTLEEEIVHLYIHGLLHVCGFDHEISRREEILMEKWEKKLLDSISRRRKALG